MMLSVGERTRLLMKAPETVPGEGQDEDVWIATLDALAGFRQ